MNQYNLKNYITVCKKCPYNDIANIVLGSKNYGKLNNNEVSSIKELYASVGMSGLQNIYDQYHSLVGRGSGGIKDTGTKPEKREKTDKKKKKGILHHLKKNLKRVGRKIAHKAIDVGTELVTGATEQIMNVGAEVGNEALQSIINKLVTQIEQLKGQVAEVKEEVKEVKVEEQTGGSEDEIRTEEVISATSNSENENIPKVESLSATSDAELNSENEVKPNVETLSATSVDNTNGVNNETLPKVETLSATSLDNNNSTNNEIKPQTSVKYYKLNDEDCLCSCTTNKVNISV